jgi:hypothetical protein
MGAAAGNGLGTTINNLHLTASGAAGNGRAQRSITCDAQRAAPRATAWRNDQVPAMHNERCRGRRPCATIKYLQCTASGDGLGTTIKYMRAAAGIGLDNTIKYLRGAAGIGLGTTIKYLRRSASGAAGNGLCTTAKYLRGAAGIGLGSTIKYLRRTTSAAANKGLGTTIKYLMNQHAGARNNWAKAHIHNSWARIQMNLRVVYRLL